jgi:hypothetical protein
MDEPPRRTLGDADMRLLADPFARVPSRAGWSGLVLVAVLAIPSTASAYFLDAGRRFDVRVRAYSQLGILTERSETPSRSDVARALRFVPANAPLAQKRAQIAVITPPEYDAFDLGQHRNFYNPELDANLSDFMQWSGADEFKFRFAWWGLTAL